MSEINTSIGFSDRLKLVGKNEKLLVGALILLYVIVNITYGVFDDATWDDDCPTRIYNATNAFNDPKQFISLWNRPLFMLIFSPFVPLGTGVVFVLMVLISAAASYYLYLGAKKVKLQNAFMVVPLLLFQTFYFSVSRNAETEPLAVALLCFGFYFLTHKKWFYFALIGGLLPLARLELAVFLVIWAFFLVKNKQYKYVLLLGVPVVLWNVAGGIIEGDFLYVLHNTIGKDNSSNRYGHTSFGHYFQRYIYLIGPVVYLFFIIGLIGKMYKNRMDLFVFVQFILGFTLYVVFSWKFNMGNAAGFLRNLIPLAPLTALIALEGYNFVWYSIIAFDESTKLGDKRGDEKDFEVLSDEEFNKLNAKNRKQYQTKVRKREEQFEQRQLSVLVSLKKEGQSRIINILIVLISLLGILTSVYLYHSLEMEIHHNLLEEFDYTNLYVTTALAFLMVALFLVVRYSSFKKIQLYLFGITISLVALMYTAVTEPPNENMNPERDTMQDVSDFYTSSYLQEKTTYVNHVWFFWANKLDKYDTLQFKPVTIENLDNAALGDIVIYETHYSHRLAGDVPLAWFETHKEWEELYRYISEDNGFQCAIFQNTDSTKEAKLSAHNVFIENHPENILGHYYRGAFYQQHKEFELAVEDYAVALKDSNPHFTPFIYFKRGLSYFSLGKYPLAIKDFKKNFALKDTVVDALFNISSSFTNLGKPDSALFYLEKAIKIDPKYENAYINKAKILKKKNRNKEAMEALNKAVEINPKNEISILERAQIHFDNKSWKECAEELSKAMLLSPKKANNYFIRGMCYRNMKLHDLSCKDWRKAKSLEDQRAVQYLRFYCK